MPRLIHTSDWHLGHRFHGRTRHEEQERFLAWLVELIERQAIDILLVAGDVFDTTTPGSRAQGLYYRFLHRLAASPCRHVVIIGGNHDSPTLLEAPRELLRQLDIHVVGMAGEDPDKEILLLRDAQGRPELVVCAVPFLRDRDIRLAEAGESLEEKERKLRQGIREHYQQVCGAADRSRLEIDPQLPLVALGHLFVAGGQTVEGDGVRELAVGGLGRIEGGSFPTCIDYLALGHLHLGQLVAGNPARRYCGAPLPMSFTEADLRKQILMVHFEGRTAVPVSLPVPIFQPFASLRGDLPALLEAIAARRTQRDPVWLELNYQGEALVPDLREQLLAAVEGSALSIVRIRNLRLYDFALQQSREAESLDDLSVEEVFERRLESAGIVAAQRPVLRQALAEITASLAGTASEVPPP